MIKKWILNNFKSIESREELEFRPLTIFTGANSSGKSTVLQSVLMISQTLQSPIMSRSIVLNGGIKKFGSYGDIVFRRQWKKDLTVGFDIENSQNRNRRDIMPWDENVDSLSCLFMVGAKSEDDLQPYLKKMQLTSKGVGEKEASVTITRIDSPSEKVKRIVESMQKQPDSEDLNYSVNVKNLENFSRIRLHNNPFANTIGVSLQHFLPEYLLCSYNIYDVISESLFDRYYVGLPRIYYLQDEATNNMLSEALETQCLEVANSLKEKADSHKRLKNKKKFDAAYDEFINNKQFFSFIELYSYCEISAADKAPLAEKIKEAMKTLAPKYAVDRFHAHIIPGVDFLRAFFSEHIWYLGPLREEPKALYPLESDIAMDEVGYKGENTAAVYDYNKSKTVEFVSPACFEDLKDLNFKSEKCSLEVAIGRWLEYLGVANDIVTNDKGKIGHELKISTDIMDLKQDLTHVGVGVSQVLPILVMSLLAKKGDVIILEQPELHLHPKVQTRLADFFVTMNAIGKQCIVETHSEYLINRLRLLVAKSDDTKIADDTMIYFVEKDRKKGCSNYRQITINPYGKIDHWPEGFFDEGEDLASQIVKAALEKRRREEPKSGK